MTEDDTFEALKRTSIPVMMKHYEEWIKRGGHHGGESLESMFSRHGWTWGNFRVAGEMWYEDQEYQFYKILRTCYNKT